MEFTANDILIKAIETIIEHGYTQKIKGLIHEKPATVERVLEGLNESVTRQSYVKHEVLNNAILVWLSEPTRSGKTQFMEETRKAFRRDQIIDVESRLFSRIVSLPHLFSEGIK